MSTAAERKLTAAEIAAKSAIGTEPDTGAAASAGTAAAAAANNNTAAAPNMGAAAGVAGASVGISGAAGTASDGTATPASAASDGAARQTTAAAAAASGRDANTTDYSAGINARFDAEERQLAAQAEQQTQLAVEAQLQDYSRDSADYARKYREATADMLQGMDNQALTDQVAGRRGGTAGARLSALQGAWQAVRAELSRQQLSLASSTARDIELLRAQGEFDKADALLRSSQQRLQALYAEAVRVEENTATNTRFEEDRQQAQTVSAAETEQLRVQKLQEQGMLLLQYGVVPPENMLQAMGMDAATAKQYAKNAKYDMIWG